MDKYPFPYHPLVAEVDVGQIRTGEIFADLRQSYGMFLVKEDGTDCLPCVVEKFTDPQVFSVLRIGVRVKFRETIRAPRVVWIEIIP